MDAGVLRSRMAGLPAGLLDHVDRVVAEARRLAPRYGINPERAALAAQAHDIARATRPADLLQRAQDLGVPVDDADRAEPVLLHGPVGARVLEREHGIQDPEVLGAAASHTTARPGMSPLEKLIFVADKVEPDKVRRAPDLEEVRRLADAGDLDGAMLAFLDLQLRQAVERGWVVHPDTVRARNELLGRRTRRVPFENEAT